MIRRAVNQPPSTAAPTLADLAPEHRLRRWELAVTRQLNGLLHGRYQGLLPGPGSEFAGSREYRPGLDEVRRMDWSVTARTTVPHVREVDADRELHTWLLVDASPSMEFGTADLDKRELTVAAVAAVGFLTAGLGNRLGAYLTAPGGLRRYPARSGRNHLLSLLRTLLGAPRHASVTTDPVPTLAYTMDKLYRSLPRRGLVVVVSDFLDGLPPDPERAACAAADWVRPLRRLAARHQVLAVEVIDPRELELPDVGVITLIDPETGRRREVCTADHRLRRRFAEAAAAQRELVRTAVRQAGATLLTLRTDRDPITDIVRHVHHQRRLAGAARHPSPAARVGGGR